MTGQLLGVLLFSMAAQAAPSSLAVPAVQLIVQATATEPVTDTSGLTRVRTELRSADRQRVARMVALGRGAESRRARLVIEGPGRRRVTVREVVNPFGMAWSPDGRTLAYCEGAILHVVDRDGAATQVVRKGAGGVYPGACFDLNWSADGRTLALTEVANADQLDLGTPLRVTLTLGVKGGGVR